VKSLLRSVGYLLLAALALRFVVDLLTPLLPWLVGLLVAAAASRVLVQRYRL